jgi:hypothetical protein
MKFIGKFYGDLGKIQVMIAWFNHIYIYIYIYIYIIYIYIKPSFDIESA